MVAMLEEAKVCESTRLKKIVRSVMPTSGDLDQTTKLKLANKIAREIVKAIKDDDNEFLNDVALLAASQIITGKRSAERDRFLNGNGELEEEGFDVPFTKNGYVPRYSKENQTRIHAKLRWLIWGGKDLRNSTQEEILESSNTRFSRGRDQMFRGRFEQLVAKALKPGQVATEKVINEKKLRQLEEQARSEFQN